EPEPARNHPWKGAAQHAHDGVTSQPPPSSSLNRKTQMNACPSAGWWDAGWGGRRARGFDYDEDGTGVNPTGARARLLEGASARRWPRRGHLDRGGGRAGDVVGPRGAARRVQLAPHQRGDLLLAGVVGVEPIARAEGRRDPVRS